MTINNTDNVLSFCLAILRTATFLNAQKLNVFVIFKDLKKKVDWKILNLRGGGSNIMVKYKIFNKV